MSITSADIVNGTEFLFVNSVNATIVVNWDMFKGIGQGVLILTAIVYNIVKIYSWYDEKFIKPKKEAQKLEDEKSEKPSE